MIQYPEKAELTFRGGPVGKVTIHDFLSCRDGKNTDSINHRTHILFPDTNTGRCAAGFKAVPQRRITLTYNVPVDAR